MCSLAGPAMKRGSVEAEPHQLDALATVLGSDLPVEFNPKLLVFASHL